MCAIREPPGDIDRMYALSFTIIIRVGSIFISIIIITIIMIIIITIIIRINNSSIFSPIKQKEKTKLIALPTMSKQLA